MSALRNIWPEDEVTSRVRTLGTLVHGDVAVISPEARVDEARELLVELRVPAVAVVEGSTLVGLVTRTDVLRAAPHGTVSDAMTRFVLALPETACVERAAALMAFEHVGVIVVVEADGGGLLGLVSAVDLARHFACEAGYLVS